MPLTLLQRGASPYPTTFIDRGGIRDPDQAAAHFNGDEQFRVRAALGTVEMVFLF